MKKILLVLALLLCLILVGCTSGGYSSDDDYDGSLKVQYGWNFSTGTWGMGIGTAPGINIMGF
jgi:outer membrane lipoprotein SlyB